MDKRIIRFCYRKVIDASSQGAWEKLVFDSTYTEFRMQAQLYNQGNKYKSFSEILLNNPSAEKLHFLVSAAVTGYVQQLGGKIPDVTDNLGRLFLKFSQYRFEIINSDIDNKTIHQVAINFFSEPIYWHDTIDGYLLVSDTGVEAVENTILTNLVQLQPFLSVYSIKE
jgi:hypothetical protein